MPNSDSAPRRGSSKITRDDSARMGDRFFDGMPVAWLLFYDQMVYISHMTVLKRPQRGRPREFDQDLAIENAMNAFWTLGYHNASLPDLLEATKLSRGSLYAAFGDKHGLFLLALDRYVTRSLERLETELQSGSPLSGVRAFLSGYADRTGQVGKRGCLIVASAMELGSHDSEVAQRIEYFFSTVERRLGEVLGQARDAGELAQEVEPAIAARLLLCAVEGMRVVDKTNSNKLKTRKMFDTLLDRIAR